MRVNYAIVFVSDMARSIVFYRDTLGLPLRFETPAWTEFATDGAIDQVGQVHWFRHAAAWGRGSTLDAR